MQKEECWKNFLTSGKVTDYLSYCRAAESVPYGENESDNVSAQTDKEPDDRVKHNAGFF